MWNLILYILAVVVGLVLYHTYDENEEIEECSSQPQDGSSLEVVAEKKTVSDFRFSSLFAVLGFSVPGETSEERFESFTENFSTFDEVIIAMKGNDNINVFLFSTCLTLFLYKYST